MCFLCLGDYNDGLLLPGLLLENVQCVLCAVTLRVCQSFLEDAEVQ